jgi:hypothetical protein
MMMAKKKFSVTLPISGYLVTEVKAEDEASAITAALDSKLKAEMIQEWEAHRRIVQGNVFHGQINEADAQEV